MHGGLIPDVSLGTHFFNDLVEHDLLYLACFPKRKGNWLDEAWLAGMPSDTPDAKFAQCVRRVDLSQFQARLWANAMQQRAGIFVSCAPEGRG